MNRLAENIDEVREWLLTDGRFIASVKEEGLATITVHEIHGLTVRLDFDGRFIVDGPEYTWHGWLGNEEDSKLFGEIRTVANQVRRGKILKYVL